jgi:hypothetical protein
VSNTHVYSKTPTIGVIVDTMPRLTSDVAMLEMQRLGSHTCAVSKPRIAAAMNLLWEEKNDDEAAIFYRVRSSLPRLR